MLGIMTSAVELAVFSSDEFAPILPDECQVNPRRYGAELAFWLCSELAKTGIVTSYPQDEDWGWFIEYCTPDEYEFLVACGNVGESASRWQIFVQPYARKLFGRDTPSLEMARPLVEGIKTVLSANSEIRDIEWL